MKFKYNGNKIKILNYVLERNTEYEIKDEKKFKLIKTTLGKRIELIGDNEFNEEKKKVKKNDK